jgi:phosphomevalonate kinase
MRILAPGKAILCGEYAVLHGAPAVSVAVDRCVRAWIEPGRGTPLSPFLVAALERTRALLGKEGRDVSPLVGDHLGVDSSALYEGEQKLGLGSSAAVTVATVGAAFSRCGGSLAERRRIFEIADEAHATAQGTRGSGIDVATSVYGGTIQFQRRDGRAEITPLELPEGVQLTFIFTGSSASTPALIGKVKALAEAQPARHQAAIDRLLSHAHAFVAALGAADPARLLASVDAYHQAMQHLGEAAGSEIVTRAHAQLAALARRHGGAAKPSGAGGGDLGVAFTVGPDATAKLREDLRSAGLRPLSIFAPAPGLREEEDR